MERKYELIKKIQSLITTYQAEDYQFCQILRMTKFSCPARSAVKIKSRHSCSCLKQFITVIKHIFIKFIQTFCPVWLKYIINVKRLLLVKRQIAINNNVNSSQVRRKCVFFMQCSKHSSLSVFQHRQLGLLFLVDNNPSLGQVATTRKRYRGPFSTTGQAATAYSLYCTFTCRIIPLLLR